MGRRRRSQVHCFHSQDRWKQCRAPRRGQAPCIVTRCAVGTRRSGEYLSTTHLADGRFLFTREPGNLVVRIDKLDLSSGSRQFWKELVSPDPTVLIDIGSDPGQIRITSDGKSYAYTYWTFEGELYLAQGLK